MARAHAVSDFWSGSEAYGLEHFGLQGVLSNTGKQRMRFFVLDPRESGAKADIQRATASWVTGKSSKPPKGSREGRHRRRSG